MIDVNNSYRRHAVSLVARKLYQDYCLVVNNFDGFGPEMYAEFWMRDFLVTNDNAFEDDVLRIFLSLLQESVEKNG